MEEEGQKADSKEPVASVENSVEKNPESPSTEELDQTTQEPQASIDERFEVDDVFEWMNHEPEEKWRHRATLIGFAGVMMVCIIILFVYKSKSFS